MYIKAFWKNTRPINRDYNEVHLSLRESEEEETENPDLTFFNPSGEGVSSSQFVGCFGQDWSEEERDQGKDLPRYLVEKKEIKTKEETSDESDIQRKTDRKSLKKEEDQLIQRKRKLKQKRSKEIKSTQ